MLIIEDDSTTSIDLPHAFAFSPKAGGFTVTSAFDGRSGLQQARDQLPDLIVLDLAASADAWPGDLQDPEVRGGDEEHSGSHSTTAKAEVIDRIGAGAGGRDDYVTKPFSPREVELAGRGPFSGDAIGT